MLFSLWTYCSFVYLLNNVYFMYNCKAVVYQFYHCLKCIYRYLRANFLMLNFVFSSMWSVYAGTTCTAKLRMIAVATATYFSCFSKIQIGFTFLVPATLKGWKIALLTWSILVSDIYIWNTDLSLIACIYVFSICVQCMVPYVHLVFNLYSLFVPPFMVKYRLSKMQKKPSCVHFV